MSNLMDLLFTISLAIFMAGNLLELGFRLNLADAFRGLRNGRFSPCRTSTSGRR